jgi:exodeoxyribonuclease III
VKALTLATWNVNSLRLRLPQIERWLAGEEVGVLAVQETKVEDAKFPAAELEKLGLQAVFHGQKSYNGVALLARAPATDVLAGIPGYADAQARVLAATVAGVRIIDVYVPNGQAPGSEKYAYKLEWLAELARYLREALGRHERLVLLGDFNIAPTDADVHDPAAWLGSVHVSEPERAALGVLLELGLIDVFRRFAQPEKSYSWWDYRAGAFRRDHGLRIDLILASRALAERCSTCRIERGPRAYEQPSDHTPVLASFALEGDI